MKRILLFLMLCVSTSQLAFSQDKSKNYLLLKDELVINYSFYYPIFRIEKISASNYASRIAGWTFERFTNMIEMTLIDYANIEMKSCKMKLLNEQEANLELKVTPLEADEDGEHTFLFELYHKPSNTYICSFKINTNGGSNGAFIREFTYRLKKTGKKLGSKIAKMKTKAEKMKGGKYEQIIINSPAKAPLTERTEYGDTANGKRQDVILSPCSGIIDEACNTAQQLIDSGQLERALRHLQLAKQQPSLSNCSDTSKIDNMISLIQNKIARIKEEWKLLPNHKLYEGPFGAFGLSDGYGEAKYQYIENSDGTRIFDGKFEYRANGMVAIGQFKNDYQVGRWEFRGGGRTSVLNFSDKGIPTGEFHVSGYSNEYRRLSNGTMTAGIVMSGPTYSGMLSGSFWYMGPRSPQKAEFDYIKSTTTRGYRVTYYYGVEHKNHDYGTIIQVYDIIIEDGKVDGHKEISWDKWRGFYKINDMTGDKEYINLGDNYPDRALAAMNIRAFLLRSSEREYYKYY